MTLTDMPAHELRADGVSLGYDGQTIVDRLDLTIPDGRITVIVGANASGKSTLLRGLARLLAPSGGHVLLDGDPSSGCAPSRSRRCWPCFPSRPSPRPASPWPTSSAAAGIRTRGGSAAGRRDDADAVAAALEATGTTDLAERQVGSAVGRPASAGVGRDGAGAADRPAAARRADHLPRHQPSDRAARPAHRSEQAARHHDGARAARAEPGVPVRRSSGGDEGRTDRRGGCSRPTSSPPRWSPRCSGWTAGSSRVP